ncbi:hypothetical protein [Mobilicoccus pelagius]|uniref:Uncharacterized protein n=1 Tax=Mobilicoccus pelagius NBRC 104925 TaxID=1089455 RepID=H5UUS5_9MICO|nr:hypothetical protein [Mobilicoccus pelagius]GAB49483.1 hypothetical protein MOPEL_130_00900 [Mobilicoccus pelagius NBRC 104925]
MTTRDGGERDDVDARFAEIVERWEEPPSWADAPPPPAGRAGGPDDGVPGAPRETGITPPGDVADDPTVGGPTDADTDGLPSGDAPPVRAGGFDDPVPWRTYSPPEDPDDETFTPPPPEPLPAFFTDWPFYLALCGLVLGPVGLVLLVVFAPTERHLMWGAAALTIAGFVTLVLRQPHDRDPDDTDDGARV